MVAAPKSYWIFWPGMTGRGQLFSLMDTGKPIRVRNLLSLCLPHSDRDVANTSMFAEAYKDVVNEYSLKVGGSHKAPDYAFRVGGVRKFFVEAKRPGVDISTDPALHINFDVTVGRLNYQSVCSQISVTSPFMIVPSALIRRTVLPYAAYPLVRTKRQMGRLARIAWEKFGLPGLARSLCYWGNPTSGHRPCGR